MDVRLAQRAKEKIEEAALVSHQTLTDFVVTNLLRASEEALKHHQAIRLTNRDRDLFLKALDAAEGQIPHCVRQPKDSSASTLRMWLTSD